MSVFATKSIERLQAEAQTADGQALKRVLGRGDSDCARHRSGDWSGNLRADGSGCGGACRPRHRPLHGHRRCGQCACRTLLRRVRIGRSRLGIRVHLRVRHVGRARGMADWLGPGARIRAQCFHRRGQLVWTPLCLSEPDWPVVPCCSQCRAWNGRECGRQSRRHSRVQPAGRADRRSS